MRRALVLWKLLLTLFMLAVSTLVFLFVLLRTTGLPVNLPISLGSLDNWVFQQVVGITQTYFVPTIDVENFQYNAPNTFIMQNVAFDAPPSVAGDDPTRVVTADTLTLTLAELPSIGKPIRISDITLTNATLRLLRDTENNDVVFRGLLPFVKRDTIQNQDQLEDAARLSEILRIETITLENFSFEYDPGTGDPPMLVDGINMTLDATQTIEEDGRIWHMLQCRINREPLFDIDLRGRLDLDTFELELFPSTVALDLNHDSQQILPPEIQALVRDYDLHGGVTIDFDGDINASDITASTLNATVTLDDLNASLDTYRIPITSGTIIATLADGVATIDPLSLDFLGGNLTALARMDMDLPGMPASADWTIEGMRLESFLHTDTTSENTSELSGRLRSAGSVSILAQDGISTLTGNGIIDFDQGKLVGIPGLTDIIELVRSSTGWRSRGTDTFHADFTLHEQGVHLDAFEYSTDVLAAEGSGWLNFNQTLDLDLAGGPVKALTGLLGDLGKIIERVTTQAIRYGISGTFDDPQFTVKPLGF